MAFSIDRHSRTPFPAQVQRQAVAHLLAGRLRSGDRLPSVRQLARELGVARQTAERIHEALGDALTVDVRPRSGSFVRGNVGEDEARLGGWHRAQQIHAFLDDVVERARELGLTPERVVQLLTSTSREQGLAPPRPLQVPVVATRDSFECMRRSLPDDFPVSLVHVPPSGPRKPLPPRSPYLLCGYYLRSRARELASRLRASLLYVRYNVELLERCMAIAPGSHCYFATRDADNAEMTRSFFASAFPEVASGSYTVRAVRELLDDPAAVASADPIWATVTAAPLLADRVDPGRIRLRHPILAEDFVNELRCLPLLA